MTQGMVPQVPKEVIGSDNHDEQFFHVTKQCCDTKGVATLEEKIN